MKHITLITGGARSGKSTRALELAAAAGAGRRYFIATGEALDAEMAARIAHHKRTRPSEFETLDAPIDIVSALHSIEATAAVAVIDCLTLWVSNLMLKDASDEEILAAADRLASALTQAKFATIVVTDEVGMGIVPENASARRFRDLLGWTNQKIAAAADEVILMVAGYALKVK
jgi:adenosylcobinamide kinase / adenosylcobinamide-phosphate guanylyltransferase